MESSLLIETLIIVEYDEILEENIDDISDSYKT